MVNYDGIHADAQRVLHQAYKIFRFEELDKVFEAYPFPSGDAEGGHEITKTRSGRRTAAHTEKRYTRQTWAAAADANTCCQIFLPAWLSLPFLSVREGLACLEATAVFINVSSFQNRAGARRPAARHGVRRRTPRTRTSGARRASGSVSAVPGVQGFLVDANDVLNAHFLHFCHIGIPISMGSRR